MTDKVENFCPEYLEFAIYGAFAVECNGWYAPNAMGNTSPQAEYDTFHDCTGHF